MLRHQLLHLQFEQRNLFLVLLLLLHQHFVCLLRIALMTAIIINHLLIAIEKLKVIIITVHS
jgi:hypothetical protein